MSYGQQTLVTIAATGGDLNIIGSHLERTGYRRLRQQAMASPRRSGHWHGRLSGERVQWQSQAGLAKRNPARVYGDAESACLIASLASLSITA
jgi:hypothetical protein